MYDWSYISPFGPSIRMASSCAASKNAAAKAWSNESCELKESIGGETFELLMCSFQSPSGDMAFPAVTRAVTRLHQPKTVHGVSLWFCWSERRDLNSGPPVPQTGALTGLRYAPTDAGIINLTRISRNKFNIVGFRDCPLQQCPLKFRGSRM